MASFDLNRYEEFTSRIPDSALVIRLVENAKYTLQDILDDMVEMCVRQGVAVEGRLASDLGFIRRDLDNVCGAFVRLEENPASANCQALSDQFRTFRGYISGFENHCIFSMRSPMRLEVLPSCYALYYQCMIIRHMIEATIKTYLRQHPDFVLNGGFPYYNT